MTIKLKYKPFIQMHHIYPSKDSKQVMLFSATLPSQILEFAKAGLRDPELIRLDVERRLPENLEMTFFHVRHEDKLAALLHLLRNILKPNEKTVIFVATKHHVELLRMILNKNGYETCYIYSSMDPAARKQMIQRFRHEDDDPAKVSNILVTTDIAARGIDIPLLDAVINYHFPPKAKLFVHRVGRVARAGRNGIAYSLVRQALKYPFKHPFCKINIMISVCFYEDFKLSFLYNVN